jgi:predicted CoA-binding protein
VTTQSALANEFLAERRLAVVGVSHHPQDFSRGLFRELLRRGYDVVPVNPARGEIEGLPCAARVQDVSPPVVGVLVMTRPEVTEQVVRDCVEAGRSEDMAPSRDGARRGKPGRRGPLPATWDRSGRGRVPVHVPARVRPRPPRARLLPRLSARKRARTARDAPSDRGSVDSGRPIQEGHEVTVA